MSWLRLESPVYWSLFVAAFIAVAVWESFAPRRKLAFAPERRWSRHGVLLAICAAVSSLVLRTSPVAIAALSANNQSRLLNRLSLPYAVTFAATVVLLDLLQYAVHWSFHHVGPLWRVHTVHHSDPDFDVSTAARFHPLEVLGVQAVVLGTIALLAPPLFAVFTAEMLKMIFNLLEHANASLPAWLEQPMRRVFVTPDLHRIHHSADEREQGCNLGQIFSWWDRLFGTYLDRPAAEGGDFVTGLKGFHNSASLALGFMLAEPFHSPAPQKDPATKPGPSA